MLMSAVGLPELTAQESKSFSSSHPAVIRSVNVSFTQISDDLYQKATDGANVQSALKDVVDKSSPQKLGPGVLYVPCLKDADNPSSFVMTPAGDYILVLLKDGRHGMIPKTAYLESVRIQPPLSELTWIDTSTKLRWTLTDNGSDINWYEAKEYCGTLTSGGLAGWRLPTIAELATIWTEYNEAHIKGGIQHSVGWMWSATVTPDNSGTAFYSVFEDAFYKGKVWADVRKARYMRALCVHSAGTVSSR
jgi:hypothetical protein